MTYLPMIVSGIVAFIVTSVLGLWIIPMLRRLKFGQTILEIGPRWHKNKEGTPTMGGILFTIGTMFAVVVGFIILRISPLQDLLEIRAGNEAAVLILNIVMVLAFAAIGFIDDYVKVAKKQNLGLTEKQKLIMQVIVAAIYVFGLKFFGAVSTIVELPFFRQINLGIFYYPIMILGIIFIINVVNFTDGVDGLCASVTLVVAFALIAISVMLKSSEMQIFSTALAGGCLGFLVWNFHPAKVFMGDVGSFFLGGMVVAIIFSLNLPAFILLLGFVYIVEGFSVVLQRFYFKYTRRKYGEGRRIFKMSPIHHHFEMSGWSENKIVTVFSTIQLVFSALAVWAVTLMVK